jgi:hypothetical protein
MEINLILLAPNAMLVGWGYFKEEKGFDFKELNLYFLFFQAQFRW